MADRNMINGRVKWYAMFLCGFLFLIPQLKSAVITSNQSGGGNWNQTATWQGGVIPASADTVIIASGDAVVLNVSTTISRLELQSGPVANTLTHQTGADVLTVSGDVLLNSPSANGVEQRWNIDAGGAQVAGNLILALSAGAGNGTRIATVYLSTGALTVNSIQYLNPSGGDNQTRVLITGSGSIDLSGGIELAAGNGTLNCGTAGRINFTGTADQTLRQTGSGLIYYHDVHIQGNTSRTVFLDANLDQAGNGQITGSLFVENGTLHTGIYYITLGGAETFAVRHGATLITQAADPNAFPAAGIIRLDTTSTVVYHRNGDQTISPQSYGNLSINSPNTAIRQYTLGGNIAVGGNLTVRQTGGFPAILEMGIYTISANASDSLILGANTRLDLSGAANFPNQFGFFNLDVNSKIQYEANTLNQTVAVSSSTTNEVIEYGTLDLRNGQNRGFSKIPAGPLVVNGDLDVGIGRENAIFNLGNYSHTVGGNWNNDGSSTLISGQSTVVFDGSNQSIALGNFYNVVFSGSEIKTITGSFNASNDLTIDSGVTLDPNSVPMTIGGNWQNDGSFTPDAGQNTIFDGGIQTISASNFADLFISGSGQKTATGRLQISNELEVNSSLISGGVVSIGGILDVNGTLTTQDSLIIQGSTDIADAGALLAGGPIVARGLFDINNGTFSAGAFTHACAANWIQNGTASIDRGSSTWVFDGGNQTITRGLFYDAIFAGSGTKTLSTTYDFDRHVTVDDGVTVSSAVAGTLGGDLIITGSGAFVTSGSLLLDGADQTLGPLTCLNLTFGGGGTKTAAGNFDINGSVFLNSAFDAGAYSHSVALNWSGSGSFYPATSTIIFDGGDSDILKDEMFYNLTLNSTGGDAALDNGSATTPTRITVNNDLHLINGELRVYGLSGTELAVGGDLTIENNTSTGIQFNSANITIDIGGDFQNLNNLGGVNDGLTSIDGTEIFNFNGSRQCNLRTSGAALPNLILNKFNGSLTLDDPLTVTRSLNLTSGILNSSSTGILQLNAAAAVIGGSETSHVSGPMIQVAAGAGSKTYPLGRNGAYRPLELYLASVTSSPAVQVELISGSPGGTTDTTTLDTISGVRYYQAAVVNAGLINSATIKINFGGDDGVSDLQSTVIAHSLSQTGLYTSLGRSASSGTPDNGSITSDLYDINETAEFFLLGFEKVRPVKLQITEIFPNPIIVDEDFQVTVQVQSRNGRPANVTTDTEVQLTRILTGSGSLSGTSSGIILAGQNQVIISGVQYGISEYLQIEASRISGEFLESDTSGLILATAAFYSNVDRNGNPAVNTNWNSQRDGSGSPPAAGALAGLFIIQADDTMSTTAAFSEYDIILRVESGGAFFNNTGITELGSLIIEGGGYVRANSEIEISSSGNFTLYDNATYIHNNTARLDDSEALFAGAENFAENSQFTALQLSTIAGSLNTFAGPSFGNLLLDLTLNTAQFSFNGNLRDVQGDLEIQSTGSGRIEFSDNDSENYTLNIGGDFIVGGGTVNLMDANALCTINIAGNLIISGGQLRVTNGAGDPVLNIANDLIISGGTLNLSAANGGISTLNLTGHLNQSGGTLSETAGGAGTIVFRGVAPQTWTAGGTLSGNALNFTVNNPAGVTLAGSDARIGGTLTLSSGRLTTAAGSIIIMESTGIISGGNATSFINGPMAHSWTTATATKIFPIGAGNDFRPIELTLTTPASPVIRAEMINSPSNGTPDNSPLVRISQVRYYQTEILSGSTGLNSARVKISWGDDDGVSDLPRLVVARSTVVDGLYSTLGQSAVSGDSLNGNITSQSYTPTASPGSDFIALGTTNIDVSLPVYLAAFSAAPVNFDIRISWRSESEVENAFWILEKAALEDSSQTLLPAAQIQFETIAQLPGQGNSNTAFDYEYIDKDITAGEWYRYRLSDVSFNGNITVHPDITVRANLPVTFALLQNYPNPFNPTTTISFTLPEPGSLTLTIYDALGREVCKLIDGENFTIGLQRIEWNGRDQRGNQVASGIYFYRLVTGKHSAVKKMMLMK